MGLARENFAGTAARRSERNAARTGLSKFLPRCTPVAALTLATALLPLVLTVGANPASAAKREISHGLLAWGENAYGELGDGVYNGPDLCTPPGSPGAYACSTTPVDVTFPPGVQPVAVAGGSDSAYAIGSDGNVYEWGYYDGEQIGGPNNATPVQVSLPTGITALSIAAGAFSAYVIGSDNNVYAWGDNSFGELGDGNTVSSTTPVKVSLPVGVSAFDVASGALSAYAIGSDGNLYAWGNNSSGELGDGSTSNSTTPVKVSLPGGATPTAIAGGGFSAYAIGSYSNLYAWGDNSFGQLGDGSTSDSTTPVQVSLPGGATPPTAIAAGYVSAYAIGSDTKPYAWGDNSFGELGDGTSTGPDTCPVESSPCSTTPVAVPLPAGVGAQAITGGYNSAYVIGSDNNLYAWGRNDWGQLGDGTSTGPDTCTSNEVPCSTAPTTISLSSSVAPASLGPEPTSLSGYVINVVPNTQTTLTPSQDPSIPFEKVTFTAQVTGSNDAPTGTVEFTDDGQPIPSCFRPVNLSAAGTASCTTSFTSTGPQTIEAGYSGDAQNGASYDTLTQTVGCTTVVTGNGAPLHGITVTSGSTCVDGGTVDGPVVVGQGAFLALVGSTLNGSIESSGTAVSLCGDVIRGTVLAQDATGSVVIGDPDSGCRPDTVSGPVTVDDDSGGIQLYADSIMGPLTVNDDTDVGALIEANYITGNLECTSDSPPPTDDGLPNNVSGSLTGLCASL
jgi:alpha-tubulin suppressor-like RCC1 family protein